MHFSDESFIVGTNMEDRWKGQKLWPPETGRGGADREGLVFYKDMRFWLILLMMAAFFAFTLIEFP